MDPKTGERFELPAVTAPNLVARSLAARRRKKKNKPAASLEAGYRGLQDARELAACAAASSSGAA